jgi:hypothetical protein
MRLFHLLSRNWQVVQALGPRTPKNLGSCDNAAPPNLNVFTKKREPVCFPTFFDKNQEVLRAMGDKSSNQAQIKPYQVKDLGNC